MSEHDFQFACVHGAATSKGPTRVPGRQFKEAGASGATRNNNAAGGAVEPEEDEKKDAGKGALAAKRFFQFRFHSVLSVLSSCSWSASLIRTKSAKQFTADDLREWLDCADQGQLDQVRPQRPLTAIMSCCR